MEFYIYPSYKCRAMKSSQYQFCKRKSCREIVSSSVIVALFLFSASSATSLAIEEDDCFNIGYRDGRDHPFDHEKYEECSFKLL